MSSLTSAVSGVGSAIGRYFSIVSFVPSLFLTSFTFALIESGAWNETSSLHWARAGEAFTHIGNLALLTLISIVLGVVVHPVQFALVQFFEGYWGTGKWAQRARAVRILHHCDRYWFDLRKPGLTAGMRLQEADNDARQAVKATAGKSGKKADKAAMAEERAILDLKFRVTQRSIADESKRMAAGYPDPIPVGTHAEFDDMMPTRLGNALRRYERLAGAQYELDAVSVIQQIAFVAEPRRLAYVGDQRQLLDLSVRMSATSIVAAVIAIASLWGHGPWLLLALAPYGAAYLSYRGAVVVAHEYGAAVAAMIDLDRFALYDALHLPRPKDTAAERRMNAKLMELLTHDKKVVLRYEHPATGNAGGQPDAR
jgi:hypothetical protein